ncbi:PREDICTED: transcription factor LHW-like isoform X2 [Nelumbo nucifera]|uniref:Transcription factor LHW-like isoform X2 n=1 Tax=Nelumbo nucifera TaxID=4432 RepID=A0A1U8A5Z2_NELNU|nr:PREDICTED: transcription factor LHW-like isoform X2 [Nelumbo nucifera]
MGTSALRQLLRNLCLNSQWNYAVFWKLKHQNRMVLTWEDGYYDHPKLIEPIESISDNVCFKETDGIKSFGCETNTSNGNSVGSPIELVVADMSCQLYLLGEGIVGKVASTAKHCWVYAGIESYLVPEYPDEWSIQFAAGIKTILLVPVLHGVVQLGSLEMVDEDLILVAHIKDMFNTLQYVGGTSLPLISNKDLLAFQSSPLTSLFLDKLADPLAFPSNMLKPIQSEASMKQDPIVCNSFQIIENKLSTTSDQLMLPFVQDNFEVLGRDLQPTLQSIKENEFGALLVDPAEVSSVQNESITNHVEMMESLFSFPCIEGDLMASYQCDDPNTGDPELKVGFYSVGDLMDQTIIDEAINGTNHINISGFLNFPVDYELQEALRPAFQRGSNEHLWDSSVSVPDACDRLSPIWNRELTGGIEQVIAESNAWFKKGGHFAASCQTQSQSEGNILVRDDSVPWNNMRSSSMSGGKEDVTTTRTGASLLVSMVSTVIDSDQTKKEVGSRRGSKLTRVTKRRSRPGENQRPRPRDRQMIQDRVKELRELVPKGEKCSIDSLLDQTVKHILFLRSVTSQSNKLRHCMRPKVSGWKNSKPSGTQNGTNWTFQMGSQLGICPIVVEDLDYPGHLLIEMLCDEHGLFLEIAQVIRHLELTILKGVLENRSNKTWAHFIVEASSGFQRMDVFWPLMQLLQRNANPISSKF